MSAADDFDAFYKDARTALLQQTFALTGDLPASRSAVRDAFVAAWHHWRKVSRLEDREEYRNSEKYEIRARDWDAEGNIKPLLGGLNRLRRYVHQVPFGCVEVEEGRVVRLEEKPALERLVNAGMYVLEPRLLPLVPRSYFPITALFERCLELEERVGAFEIEDDWMDVGQREQLRAARQGPA